MTKRPDIWIGHRNLPTHDIDASHKFFCDTGLRHLFREDDFSIYELRGGTHLIIHRKDEQIDNQAEFDFMVEDIDAMYAQIQSFNYSLTELERGEIHDWFFVTEPGGNTIKFNSTHVEDHSLV